MKRYIITIKEFEGIQIKRFDGYFKAPFETTEQFKEDTDGWVWCSRTAAHMKLLLRHMEQMGKATKFAGADRFERTWVIDVPGTKPMGQYYPFRDKPMTEIMVPPIEAVKFMPNDEPDLYDLDETDQDFDINDVLEQFRRCELKVLKGGK
jgi:hypothetical protein